TYIYIYLHPGMEGRHKVEKVHFMRIDANSPMLIFIFVSFNPRGLPARPGLQRDPRKNGSLSPRIVTGIVVGTRLERNHHVTKEVGHHGRTRSPLNMRKRTSGPKTVQITLPTSKTSAILCE
ncbi:hypothetical protein J6590_079041, partial [Homalodisca vitripennis]